MTGRIKQRFRNGRDSISGFQTTVSNRTRRAVSKTDYYIHDHAWKMIGVAAGLAFFAGFILSQRNQEAIAASVDAEGSTSPEVKDKIQRLNSWELIHSSIPLALFFWKAVQASRCARKGMV